MSETEGQQAFLAYIPFRDIVPCPAWKHTMLKMKWQDVIAMAALGTLPERMDHDLTADMIYRLMDDFRRDGKFVNPIMVRIHDGGKYQVTIGQTRWFAAAALGYDGLIECCVVPPTVNVSDAIREHYRPVEHWHETPEWKAMHV